MNYYIADLHLGHENIIKLNNRPFKSVQEMDRILIDNWNKVITVKDDVYIIGDLCFRTSHDNMFHYISELNGRKHLIIGNHDVEILKNNDLKRQFIEVTSYKELLDDGQRLVLFHYPMVEWNGYYRDTLLLYGHIHNNYKNSSSKYIGSIANAYNVGADILGFVPRTLKDIKQNDKWLNGIHMYHITN